jgi:hypothetical protein|tara:strand:- start:178 stop:339 length:162 start_codon:yes stop_codon:yes gene_type:complete
MKKNRGNFKSMKGIDDLAMTREEILKSRKSDKNLDQLTRVGKFKKTIYARKLS